ncbi:MAG: GxxExxY protein [Anaerolineales bacterium]|jgi:GxxExxY protein|nr:GxxExxY protein [Anaerolineales bacterium]
MDVKRPVSQVKFEGKHSEIADKVLRAFFDLHTELGYGFSEKVYENSLSLLMQERGLKIQQQMPIHVYFHGKVVGEYIADALVSHVVVVELKAVSKLNEDHAAQPLNYLKATDYEVGLLLNFGQTAEFRRKVYDNERKGSRSWVQK